MRDKEKAKKKPLLYRIIRKIILVFYKKREFIGLENVTNEPCLFIGNHAQMNGPLTGELFFPLKKRIWCIGQMMNRKEVPAYAFQDFWSNKPKVTRWFYKLLSHIIAPLSCLVFNNSDTIGVYKDTRIINTYKETLKHLQDGSNIIIYPECYNKYNEIVNDFQDKFIDVARMYYNKYQIALSFVPMYNAAKLKKVLIGKPIQYNPDISIDEQRKMICDYLKQEITKLAKSLPAHKVVPYENVSSKHYKYSKNLARKKSVNLYYVNGVDTKQKLDLIKKLGYDEYFTGIYDEKETMSFEQQVQYAKSIGLNCSMVHCQYFDDITNHFWLDDELGEKIQNSYLEQIKKCKGVTKNFVVHLNEGQDCECSEVGLKRIQILLEECEKNNINLCVENLESEKEIPYIFQNIKHQNLKICFDIGHKNFLYPQFDILNEYKEYIAVLHIHDNNGQKDEHKVCFSGTVEWENVAKGLADTELVLSAEIKIKDKNRYKTVLKQNLKSLQKLEKLINKYE